MLATSSRQLISKDAARQELARRELARRELLRFGQYMLPHFRIYKHQRLIAEALNRVVEFVTSRGQRGKGRLMIMTQPQVGKSLVASNLFPAWALGNHPDLNFILTSYNDDRAQANSKAVRDLIDNPRYRSVFGDLAKGGQGVALSSDSRGAKEWRLAAPYRGGAKAAGVGGGITGRPADIVIIDDPFKSREEAESQARRDLVLDWYESQVYSRQQAGMAIILFHTRWAEEDLAGLMLKAMASREEADQWEVLFLPALALEDDEYPQTEDEQRQRMMDGVFVPMADPMGRKPGEALCPEILPREMLLSIRSNMSSYNFLSLYQQMPYSRSGNVFERGWFKIEKQLPEGEKITRALWYWDKASTAGAGDYSVGVLMGVSDKGRYWVLTVARGQWSTFEREKQMRESYEQSLVQFPFLKILAPQLWHQQDPGSAGVDSARATNKSLAPIPAHFEPLSGNKETRAEPWSSCLEADNARLLAGPWNKAFIDEHVSFPRGRNDDQVDAGSSAYSKLISLAGKKRESKIL
jgi:predicted phage terminase large subunit-like protein